MRMNLKDASGPYMLVEKSYTSGGGYICLPVRDTEYISGQPFGWAHLTREETEQLILLLKNVLDTLEG